jgi:tRNA (guanine37-N1)-methyltransferase
LDCPWYTRPEEYNGKRVPEVLQNGDHRQTEKWRRLESLKKTFLRRPDLLEKVELDPEELKLISQWKREEAFKNSSRLNKGT